MKNLSKGIYITIEGIDGSGKTTLAKSLYNYLKEKYPTYLTKEPSETVIGKQLRELLTKKVEISDRAEYLFFASDRAQHFHEIIIPKLKANEIIISDRSGDSSLAYQGYGRGLDVNVIKQVNEWAMNGIKPDIIFYLKIDPKVALERIYKRNETITNFENLEFLKKIANGFEDIFKSRNNVITLDASKTQQELLNDAIKQLENKNI